MRYSRFIKTGIFIVLLWLAATAALGVVRKRNAHNEEFIANLSNAEVLILGSSHAYNNLNGAVMWNDYGITAACLGQGEQPISMSYYALKSALTYNKPKVVVLEVYMAVGGNEHDEKPQHYAKALLDYPIWRNLGDRIEAASLINTPNKLEYILGFPVYHTDYMTPEYAISDELTAGFNYLFGTNEEGQKTDRHSTGNVEKKEKLGSYAQEYFVKIAQLCKDEGIPLLFLLTPFQADEKTISYINTVAELAEEMAVPFLDMNCYVDEIGIDLDREMCDWGHARVTGGDKNARWLGAYLMEHYDITDNRMNADYAAWNEIYNTYVRIKRTYVSVPQNKPPRDYLREVLYDDMYECYVWLADEGNIYQEAKTMQILQPVLDMEEPEAYEMGRLYGCAALEESQLQEMKEMISDQLDRKQEAELIVVVKEKATGTVIGQAAYKADDEISFVEEPDTGVQ